MLDVPTRDPVATLFLLFSPDVGDRDDFPRRSDERDSVDEDLFPVSLSGDSLSGEGFCLFGGDLSVPFAGEKGRERDLLFCSKVSEGEFTRLF